VNAIDLTGDGRLDLLVCESSGLRGRIGRVTLYQRQGDPGGRGKWTAAPLALLPHPAHTAVLDFDGDSDLDIIVAVLGIFGPSESPKGQVTLLVNEGGLRFTSHAILTGVTRVADVQPADFSGDGRIDFAVAEFGHRTTGSVGWLENDGRQQFTPHSLARIPRSLVTLELADLDEDGRLDLIAGGLLMPGYAGSRATFDIRAPLSLWSRP
jgi:hypothetical protein